MRLLNSTTLKLSEFFGNTIPSYAILSHTWGFEEVLFEDIEAPASRQKKGFKKIQLCCAQAKRDGYKWAWVDTCCIDKSSSAELSEAINSMYNWYKAAQICYVYLEDVKFAAPAYDPTELKESRWFTRGWTLQELLAPSRVEFYSSSWFLIGSKTGLADLISDITRINTDVLLLGDVNSSTVATRLSWASSRETTRVEDEAYCLMGIFDVNMPLLYGERGRAFRRLQEQIMNRHDDITLFAWTTDYQARVNTDLFAFSPKSFSSLNLRPETVSGPLNKITAEYLADYSTFLNAPPQITPRGVRVELPLRKSADGDKEYLAWIYLADKQHIMNLVCIPLHVVDYRTSTFSRIETHFCVAVPFEEKDTFKLTTIYVVNNNFAPKFARRQKNIPFKLVLEPKKGHHLNAEYLRVFSRSNYASTQPIIDFSPRPGEALFGYNLEFDPFMEVVGLKCRYINLDKGQKQILTIVVGCGDSKMPWCEVYQTESFPKDLLNQMLANQTQAPEPARDRFMVPLNDGGFLAIAARKTEMYTFEILIEVCL
jgi:hypothetical protein